jgi:hypothetical protein
MARRGMVAATLSKLLATTPDIFQITITRNEQMDSTSNKRKAVPDDRDRGGQNKRLRVRCFCLCYHEKVRTRMSWPRISVLVLQL